MLVDYTVQAVWSFCNSQLTVITDRTTRTVSGAEEMLLHVAIRSADRFVRLHLSIGTFNTCTAPTGMLEMTAGGFKIINFRLLFTYFDLIYAYTDCFLLLFTGSSQQAGYVLSFLGKIFIISITYSNRTFGILLLQLCNLNRK